MQRRESTGASSWSQREHHCSLGGNGRSGAPARRRRCVRRGPGVPPSLLADESLGAANCISQTSFQTPNGATSPVRQRRPFQHLTAGFSNAFQAIKDMNIRQCMRKLQGRSVPSFEEITNDRRQSLSRTSLCLYGQTQMSKSVHYSEPEIGSPSTFCQPRDIRPGSPVDRAKLSALS